MASRAAQVGGLIGVRDAVLPDDLLQAHDVGRDLGDDVGDPVEVVAGGRARRRGGCCSWRR